MRSTVSLNRRKFSFRRIKKNPRGGVISKKIRQLRVQQLRASFKIGLLAEKLWDKEEKDGWMIEDNFKTMSQLIYEAQLK